MSFSVYSARDIKNFFAKHKASIRKTWGQNFLTDPNTSRNIANIISEKYKTHTKLLLEVGPGFGSLSQELFKKGYSIYAVEIDAVLNTFLHESKIFLTDANQEFWLLQQDILVVLKGLYSGTSFSFQKIGTSNNRQTSLLYRQGDSRIYGDKQPLSYVYGNLPYCITTDFFVQLMHLDTIAGGIFLIQKEYAQNILDTVKHSSIAVLLHNYGKWQRLLNVGPKCFYPSPKVESTLIEYQAYTSGPLCSPQVLEKLLRLSFRGRRKKLHTNWKNNLPEYFPHLSLKKLLSWAEKCDINMQWRAEDIDYQSFYCLSREIEQEDCALDLA